MSVLDGAGAVHSMPSYELSERVVLFQQRFGVASTQVMKPRAIRALGVLVLDDAKHREPQPTRRRLAPWVFTQLLYLVRHARTSPSAAPATPTTGTTPTRECEGFIEISSHFIEISIEIRPPNSLYAEKN